MAEKINFRERKAKAFEIVKQKGPILPSHVARETKTSLLFISALLSELTGEKAIKVSNMKVGGSPLYYIEGQQKNLQNFSQHLPIKERETLKELQKKGIIEDENAGAATRFALRNLKDFAVPLRVPIKGEQKLFWKWHFLSESETAEKLKSLTQASQPAPIKKQKPIKTSPYILTTQAKQITQITQAKTKPQYKIIKKQAQKQTQTEKKPLKKDEFLERVQTYLKKNDIKILEQNIVRKNRNIDFTVNIASSLGNLRFFAIAKNKKRISPADLVLTYQRGQEKKLPILFLCNGKLTKKAIEKAQNLGIIIKFLA